MKEILIVNLTRMGDLVQTTPVIRGLKEKYPGVRITLLVNAAFSEICRYIPDTDRVFALDIDRIIRGLNGGGLVEAFRYVEESIGAINDGMYDLVINFTHSNMSAVLTSLFNTRETRGLSMNDEGFTIKRHPWIRCFFNVIPGRGYNPFHLCDMYLKAAGLTPGRQGLHLDMPDDVDQRICSLFKGRGISDGDTVVGLQLGASAEDKRWPIASFVALADRLVESFGVKVVLTGSVKEADFGRSFESLARAKPLNLIGRTDLSDLVAVLRRCNLFISNDTGPLHIATAVGTKTVNISLGSVHFRETGPYGDGHYVIKAEIPCSPCDFYTDCTDTVCKRTVSVNSVFELSSRLLMDEDVSSMDDSPVWRDVQVYKSYFDADGLIEYLPLVRRRPLNKEILFTAVYKRTWLNVLDSGDKRSPESICDMVSEHIHASYDTDSLDLRALVEDELAVLKRLEDLARNAYSIISIIEREARKASPDIDLIKKIWTGVPHIDQEIETAGYTCPALRPLTNIFKYEKEELEEKEIVVLSEKACKIYNDLGLHVSMMIAVLESLLQRFPGQRVSSGDYINSMPMLQDTD
ncbi:MAG: glycosyltransferase family 9 protein [Nitrospirae bacterium]|nr:glycosyltransferase family 9 protein [Nitrospirota bacterium]